MNTEACLREAGICCNILNICSLKITWKLLHMKGTTGSMGQILLHVKTLHVPNI